MSQPGACLFLFLRAPAGESIAGEADAEESDTAAAENGGLVRAAHGKTRGYMAPEQTAAQDEPERTAAVQTGAPSPKQKGCDVWSFGLLLAAMLGGKVAKGAAEYRKQASAGLDGLHAHSHASTHARILAHTFAQSVVLREGERWRRPRRRRAYLLEPSDDVRGSVARQHFSAQ